jgi:hypothetical protein
MTVDWKKVLILNLSYLLFVYLFDITSSARAVSIPASRVSGRWCCPVRTIFPVVPKSAGIRVQNGRRNRLWRLFRVGASLISHVERQGVSA